MTIRYLENQLVIQNSDIDDWSNVRFEINTGTLRRGYILEANVNVMEAGKTYTVGVMQITKQNGERFNPFSMKLQSITISADTPQGRRYYFGDY